MPTMIQPQGVLLDDDVADVVVAVGTIVTGTVVACVSVVTMMAGLVVVSPGAVVVTSVVVVIAVVVVSVVVASVVVGSATVRVLVGSDWVAVADGLVAVAPVLVLSALPPPPPQAASAKPAVPATARSGPNRSRIASPGRRSAFTRRSFLAASHRRHHPDRVICVRPA
jgi:hypothetical protein